MSYISNFGSTLNPTSPFGAKPLAKGGVRFTLFCRKADTVWLLLFKKASDAKPFIEKELHPDQHRFGDLWSIDIPEAEAGHFYLYRMAGPNNDRHDFSAQQWILDPYAQAIAGHPKWGVTRGLKKGERIRNGAHFPKGVIVDSNFDWGDDRPLRLPYEETIFYETHARGFTKHSSSKVKKPGTYAGLIEKIPYLKSLGITAVELLPVFEFNELEYFQEDDPRAHHRNYWGYSTLAFWAPNGRYAADGNTGGQVNEFKALVKALHEAGLEIILDVVFNHTAEGGRKGPTYSFRGIDNELYYLFNDEHDYHNYSGCGNSVNSNHPLVQDFILECLKYWVTEYHIDGFRFDLATALTRGEDGHLMNKPPLIRAIDEDPILTGTKLIAEAWDAAGGYQVGHFPSARWPEWNGKYRDDIRAFWKGDLGMMRRFVHRLVGSDDLYHGQTLGAHKSVNFITCHDGFTLNDVVSYSKKHNEANGEDNRDGENHNHSYNFGVEGPTRNPHILAMRKRQQKNMLATLLCSRGLPMLLAGDEFSSTQDGNNNAYCQDSELSWLDWSLLKKNKDLVAFVKQVIEFRKTHTALGQADFPKTELLKWFGPHGSHPDWDHGKAIAMHLDREDTQPFIIIFNADEKDLPFTLPKDNGKKWTRAFTTDPANGKRIVESDDITVRAGSMVAFSAASK